MSSRLTEAEVEAMRERRKVEDEMVTRFDALRRRIAEELGYEITDYKEGQEEPD